MTTPGRTHIYHLQPANQFRGEAVSYEAIVGGMRGVSPSVPCPSAGLCPALNVPIEGTRASDRRDLSKSATRQNAECKRSSAPASLASRAKRSVSRQATRHFATLSREQPATRQRLTHALTPHLGKGLPRIRIKAA